jgi:hypothetical protein
VGVFELFSAKKRREAGEVSDVYQYDKLPDKLRVQLCSILVEVMGSFQAYDTPDAVFNAYKTVLELVCREHGVFTLSGRPRDFQQLPKELFDFILNEQNVDLVMDVIQVCCIAVERVCREAYYAGRSPSQASRMTNEAIDEINIRFQQNSVGYRYEGGQIMRIDSEFVHAEVVKPALVALHGKSFAGAEAEFRKAHEHYRTGHYKECLAECLKTIESTIKVIAKSRKWAHPPNATAQPLIALMFDKGLIPQFWATHFGGLRSMLESGVPTGRNRMGGHGQGGTITAVPASVAGYALHQTAAAVVFLAQVDKELP